MIRPESSVYCFPCYRSSELQFWRAARDSNPQPPDPEAGGLRPPSAPECCWCSSGRVPNPARPLESGLGVAGGLAPGLTPRAQRDRRLAVMGAGSYPAAMTEIGSVGTLGDLLASRRRRRFAGRTSEGELFRLGVGS